MIIDRKARLAASLAALALVAACHDDPPAGPGTDSLIVLVEQLSVPANYGLHDQFIRDGYAFLSLWDTGLRIYDVGAGTHGGTPADPVLVGSVVTAANGVADGPAVHNAWWYHAPNGDRKYVFIGQEGRAVPSVLQGSSGDIHVVDVSDMSQPVEVAFFHMDGIGAPIDSAGAHNFWVDEANEVLFAAFYNGGVVALDISGTLSGDLAAREIHRIRPGGAGNTYVWGVHVSGSRIYASDMLSGLWQLEFSGTAFSVVNGGNNVPERYTSDLWVTPSRVFTGTWHTRDQPGNAVKIWSRGTNGAPVLSDSIIIPDVEVVSDVEVSPDGSMLLFSTEVGPGSGIYLYDLTTTRPTRLARYLVGSGVHTATFSEIGGRLYVFAARNPDNPALLVFDVTDAQPSVTPIAP